MAKSFSDIYGEVWEQKFGKPAVTPVPTGSQELAKEISRAAATADAQTATGKPVAEPKQQTETKPAKMIECPSCKAHSALSEDAWETAEEAAATGDSDSDEDQEDEDEDSDSGDSDSDDTPAWENTATTGLSFRTRKATASERRSLKRE